MSEAVYIAKRTSAAEKLQSKGMQVTVDRTGSANFTAYAVMNGASKQKDEYGAPIGDYEYTMSADGTNEPKIGDRFQSGVGIDEVIIHVEPVRITQTVILWTITTRKG